MRTTLDIDDDVLLAAKSLALSRKVSLGRALSQLARVGLMPTNSLVDDDLFPTFRCSKDAPIVTAERIKEAMEEW
jgi:hypothetical protein